MGFPRGPAVLRDLLTTFGAFMIVLCIAAPMAAGVPDPQFDPRLSLIGGCGGNLTIDPVEDPGCPGGLHPPQKFSDPRSIATDPHGDIYVASHGKDTGGSEGRVDVFDAQGFYVTTLEVPTGPRSIAVDSKGTLYVFHSGPVQKIIRYVPTLYVPATGEIAYEDPPELVVEGFGSFLTGLAVNPLNDHLFVNFGHEIGEFDDVAEGNKLIDKTIGEGVLNNSHGMSVEIDASRKRIYASDNAKIRVFDLDPPHSLLQTIDGSEVPEIPSGSFANELSVAADEETGHVFIYDGGNGASSKTKVYEFSDDGKYLLTVDFNFSRVFGADIDVDNGAQSPNGASNPDGRYLFVPSHPSGDGHSFALGPPPSVAPPVLESISAEEVTENDVELTATIDPEGLETTYTFEYATQQGFEEEGWEGALLAGSGAIPVGSVGVEVSTLAGGLAPETAYRFKVTATNAEGSEEGEGSFVTYPFTPLPPCPNDILRTGFSALLPDCRAYELVTPGDTNARMPIGVADLGTSFGSRQASPSGEKVSFLIEGGSLSGSEGTGSWSGEPYLVTRLANGWSTSSAGPSGAEAVSLLPGTTSPDQGHSFWSALGGGSAAPGRYVRYPDGHSALVGRGSLDTDSEAEGKLISENGTHIHFVSGVPLEEEAPPAGTEAIYDRTPDEVTHVVSLLPGNVTPTAGQNALYQGASLDGEGIAFSIGNKLYLRHDNEETYEVGENVTFAGVAEGGERIFYLKAGKLLAFDVEDGVIEFNTSGSVTPVNVSADGTVAYFVSTTLLTGEANPKGQLPKVGEQNLYLSEEGAISFVGIVTKRDVEGELGATELVGGLGLWTRAVGPSEASPGRYGIDPSRTTPDGSVLLFESRANLTDYDSDEHAQIYRYDSAGNTLDCLSCNPTGAKASSDASLQSIAQEKGGPEPFNSYSMLFNLRADGRRAFFQSEEALVANDVDGLQDVYEWEGQGVGSCEKPGGCVYLISSGQSERVDYLYAVSDSGDDVFFRSSDLLVPADSGETPSIYDARVGGGFEEQPEVICEGEACRPGISPAPALLPPAKPALGAHDNTSRRCPKGKRKVNRGGKVRCVKKKRGKPNRRRAGSAQKGAGK